MVRALALLGLVVTMTFGAVSLAPTFAGAQSGYEGGDEGGSTEQTEGPTVGGDVVGAPQDSSGSGSLPFTGGLALIGLALLAVVVAVALRRMSRT